MTLAELFETLAKQPPTVGVDSPDYYTGGIAPRVSSRIGVPAFGGEIGIEGNYRPDNFVPEWGITGSFKKRF